MHISIADDIKKQFHAACALRGLKMSHVVVEMIQLWLATNDSQSTNQVQGQSTAVK
ncbi:hypothetical protein [Nostoc sphaeroides]|uniref:Arc family DNA-binding protein n=1 Tax=Nostoc sphaeroides CCNUC1 TaxID=2653204 RepID=A0A5P8WH49_9NOSO|nr:hypothetical protein [Nostoc sphaeroides]QFS52115.1 hypothetical protein GXM_09609 [Nostoc sphaeroides CCNUC1]